MPALFWIEFTAYAIFLIGNLALALMVLATGLRRTLNWLFAAFSVAAAVWAAGALMVRVALLLGMDSAPFWLELAAWALNLMGPTLLAFAVRYVDRPTKLVDRAVAFGLVAISLLAFPVFSHRLLYNPRVLPNGYVTYDISHAGQASPLMAVVYFAWATFLFWRERRRTGETYLAASTFILLAAFVVGGILRPLVPYPILTIGTVSVFVLGYGIVSRQLLNPLRDLTLELERQVGARTRDVARAEEQLQDAMRRLDRRATQADMAMQVGLELTAELDLDTLLNSIASRAVALLGASWGGLFLYNPEQQLLEWAVAAGECPVPLGQTIQPGEGLAGRVWETGTPLVIDDYVEWAGRSARFETYPIGAVISIPVRAGEELLGVLNVVSSTPGSLSEEDIEQLTLLASHAAIALRNARLLEQVERSLEAERRAYSELSYREWMGLLRTRPEPALLRDARGISQVGTVQRPEMQKASLTGETVLAESDPTSIAVPIRIREHVIGAIGARKPRGADAWTTQEIDILEALVDQLGVTLEGARLYRDSQQRAVREQMRAEITAQVRASTDVDTILQTAIRELGQALRASGGTIALEPGDGADTPREPQIAPDAKETRS